MNSTNSRRAVAAVQVGRGERLLGEAVAGALRDLIGQFGTVDLVDRAPIAATEASRGSRPSGIVIDLTGVDISVSIAGGDGSRHASTRVESLHELARLARLGAGAPALPVKAEPRHAPTGDHLTDRELEVLARMRRGETNQAIAAALGISVHTVRGYVGSIMRKLNASSRVEAMTRSS